MMMGFIFNAGLMVASIAIIFYFTPSVLHPVVWTNPSPLRKPDEALVAKNLLSFAQKITSELHKFAGPESFAMDQDTGEVFASMNDGTVVKFDSFGNFLGHVFFVGGFMRESTKVEDSRADIELNVAADASNNGIGSRTKEFMDWCNLEAAEERLAWNVANETSCGRPLGLRLMKDSGSDKGVLYILDAYYGLFALDLGVGRVKHVFSQNTVIRAPSEARMHSTVADKLGLASEGLEKKMKEGTKATAADVDPVIFMQPKFFNDFDIIRTEISTCVPDPSSQETGIPAAGKIKIINELTAPTPIAASGGDLCAEGERVNKYSSNIYIFSESSYKFHRSQNRQEVTDGAPRGRLMQYDEATQTMSVLLCGLHFPNGVQLVQQQHQKQQRGDRNTAGSNNSKDSVRRTEILVNELTRFRTLIIDLSAPFLSGEMLTKGMAETIPSNIVPDQQAYLKGVPAHLGEDRDMVSMRSLTSCDEYGSLYHALDATSILSTGSGSYSVDHSSRIADKDGEQSITTDERRSSSIVAAAYAEWGIKIFSDSAPGIIDNIRPDTKISDTAAIPSHYLVGCTSKSILPFSFLWWSLQASGTFVREIAGRFLPMQYVEQLVPKYGLVYVLDREGEVVHVLHDSSGAISLLSEVQRHPLTGDLWLGSHSNPFIGILKAEYLPASWG